MPLAIHTRSVCSRCGETKTPADFHRSKRYVSGRCSVCKVCRKAEARAYVQTESGRAVIEAAKARYRASDHGRAREREALRQYRQSPEGRVAVRRARAKIDPIKVKAWKRTEAAVRRGRLVPQACEVCGSTPTHAHHDDYSKPLQVRWLCPLDHRRHHGMAR